MPHNGRVTSASSYVSTSSEPLRHLLVLPDRDAAEEAADEAGRRFGLDEDPQIVREALAGEDDAEDAQWLVVLEDPDGDLDVAALRELADEYDGWLEVE
ncbi:hypothetical protein [Streptomyces luteosporeus]|uniref:Uncharacterized protein n=1 Tax=Streptomyces luteosporeus TaxID=173856 RepID=A0ABP6GPN6_9ACTN